MLFVRGRPVLPGAARPMPGRPAQRPWQRRPIIGYLASRRGEARRAPTAANGWTRTRCECYRPAMGRHGPAVSLAAPNCCRPAATPGRASRPCRGPPSPLEVPEGAAMAQRSQSAAQCTSAEWKWSCPGAMPGARPQCDPYRTGIESTPRVAQGFVQRREAGGSSAPDTVSTPFWR